MTREGETYNEPEEAIFGPKAMIINEFAGSGGDAMPWYFRKAGVGPLVGTRTWGGLVGIGGYPQLIDGGAITAPRWAIYGLKGQWEVENHGISPDVEVELDPKLVREGHDPQLERAVEVVLDLLKKHPLPSYPAAALPELSRHAAGAGAVGAAGGCIPCAIDRLSGRFANRPYFASPRRLFESKMPA